VQVRRRTPGRCAAALVAAAIATTLTACSSAPAKRRGPVDTRGPGQGWVRVAAPDTLPRATVAVGGRQILPGIIAQDWSARGGPVRVPEHRVTWRRIPPASAWALRIA
jgi:hypothetical protein